MHKIGNKIKYVKDEGYFELGKIIPVAGPTLYLKYFFAYFSVYESSDGNPDKFYAGRELQAKT